MRFAFDDQQLEFRAQLRQLTERRCTPSDVREAWSSPEGWSPERWRALADLGVVGLTVPTDLDGLGLGLVDLAPLLEEAGWAALPEPLLDTTALAVPLLVGLGGDAAARLRADILPEVVAGRCVVTVAEPRRHGAPGAGGADTATSTVPTSAADVFLLEHDGEIHAVPSRLAVVTARAALDGARRPGEVRWAPSDGTRLASADEAADALDALGDRGAVASAAVLVGLAARMIDMAAGYSRDRSQFGHPIGSFQAVKHLLANALVRLEFARPVVYRAAWSLAAGDADAPRHASMAKACASEAALLAARTALQVHGAVGYTWEHDLHLWMKRAWALAAAWGDAGWHRARVLATLVDHAT